MIRILVEIVLFVAVLAAFATQVFWPAWRGTPLFPAFRKVGSASKAEMRASEDLDDAKVEAATRMTREEAAAIRSGRAPKSDNSES